MVAQNPPTRFTPDPARVEEFLEDISSFDMCFRDVASKWGTTVGGLATFITSEDGLQTIATAELAAALRIRLIALNRLPSVVEALGYIVMEYSREERRIPLENSLRRIRLLELKRANAHRAGTLIFKLAHFNPRPIKSYTVRPSTPPTPEGDTAVALGSRGLAHETHACAEPQACHTDETLQVSAFVDAISAQTCGMPTRPLGHGEASDIVTAPITTSACACHDHPRPYINTGSKDGCVSARATEFDGSASLSVQDDRAVRTPTATSISSAASTTSGTVDPNYKMSSDPPVQSDQSRSLNTAIPHPRGPSG